MNYFAHALPFLENPYLAAGTGVPDWLSVCDRPVRMRTRRVEPFCTDDDDQVRSIARGVWQHLQDDARFHATRAFAETLLELTMSIRGLLHEENGFRPSIVGHLLVEVLLDATLIAEHPRRLEEYYRVLEVVEGREIQETVNRMATQPTERLATMIFLFRRERILWDYLEDDKLLVRLNQVMRRLGLEPLPGEFSALLPAARRLVADRHRELLEGTPSPGSWTS